MQRGERRRVQVLGKALDDRQALQLLWTAFADAAICDHDTQRAVQHQGELRQRAEHLTQGLVAKGGGHSPAGDCSRIGSVENRTGGVHIYRVD